MFKKIKEWFSKFRQALSISDTLEQQLKHDVFSTYFTGFSCGVLLFLSVTILTYIGVPFVLTWLIPAIAVSICGEVGCRLITKELRSVVKLAMLDALEKAMRQVEEEAKKAKTRQNPDKITTNNNHKEA